MINDKSEKMIHDNKNTQDDRTNEISKGSIISGGEEKKN